MARTVWPWVPRDCSSVPVSPRDRLFRPCGPQGRSRSGRVAPKARIAAALSPCRPPPEPRLPEPRHRPRRGGATAPSCLALQLPATNAAGHRASAVWRCRTAAASPQRRFSHGARRQSRPPSPTHRLPEISGNIGRATKNPAEKARHAGQSSARLLCTRARSPNFRQVRGRGPGEQPQARPPVGERRSEYEQA